MKFKLIASDLDGTLVNSEFKLTERTKSAILRAVDAGVIFVAATGRPLRGIDIVNDLFDVDMPFIVFNGAAAYMGKSKKLLFESFLDYDLAKEAFDIGQKLNLGQVVWTDTRLRANRICPGTLRYNALYSNLDMPVISELSDIGDDASCISKVLWIAEPERIGELQVEMNAHFGDKLNCFSSLPFLLEFVSPSSTKGTALAEVGRILGIGSHEMIAFGDAYNDVSMLEYVGFSVAMANAHDDIKQACDHVTSSNDEDGVAVAIERFVLNSN
ncbi:MAG: Cof-type HAD-IIB family hydrolase [Oscillospiraceae bacterium]|nr:Cof-type HAD-IIB family hydrolase [Oscillospiraceae bacterium]